MHRRIDVMYSVQHFHSSANICHKFASFFTLIKISVCAHPQYIRRTLKIPEPKNFIDQIIMMYIGCLKITGCLFSDRFFDQFGIEFFF